MKIEAANLVLYNEDWDNREVDLRPAPLEVIVIMTGHITAGRTST